MPAGSRASLPGGDRSPHAGEPRTAAVGYPGSVRKGARRRPGEPVRLPDLGGHSQVDMRSDFAADCLVQRLVLVLAASGPRLGQVAFVDDVGEKLWLRAVGNAQEVVEARLGGPVIAGKGLQRQGDFR